MLTEEQRHLLQRYQTLVLQKNTVLNLTAIRDPDVFYEKHILDSLACAQVWEKESPPGSLVDVGTGAGFPGIVLAIAYPKIACTLVESIKKKFDFLQEVQAALGIQNLTVVHARAEALHNNPGYQHKFDIATARAVAPLQVLIPLLVPFIRPSGKIVAMKGQKAAEEIEAATAVLGAAAVRVSQLIPYRLPHDESFRALVVIDARA